MTFGSLFSGIGGLDLGLERAGMTPTWQVEINPFCREILYQYWPVVPKHIDIHDVNKENLTQVDLIAGGLPCQAISQAAARTKRGAGWLWHEMFRVIKDLRPKLMLLENPAGLRYAERGLHIILNDLASIGYDGEWETIEASAVGAPHRRARIWLVAYPNSDRKSRLCFNDETQNLRKFCTSIRAWDDPSKCLRVVDGASHRIQRCKALGNAVVPQVAEFVGNMLIQWSKQ